jgi:hypothetical protein
VTSREIERLTDVVRSELDDSTSERANVRGKERMMDALTREAASPRSRKRGLTMVALLAACLASVAIYLAWPAARLTFVVRGGEVARLEGGAARFSASAAESGADFSDGSHVTFAPFATGRIENVGARGARVVLENGSVHLDVVHRAATSWSVEAGPHVVRVTGTEFDVSWDPSSGHFSVRMLRGSVRIEGPSAPNGVALEAGYVLEAERDGSVTIRPDGPLQTSASAAPWSEASATRVADASGHPSELGSADAPSSSVSRADVAIAPPSTSSPAARGDSWAELVSQGHYDEVVRAAHSDLVALSDAARYVRDGTVARAVLEAERARFGATEAGHTATFLLGRLAEDSGGDVNGAIALYDEYLGTGGPFAAEALGRKMNAVRRTRGDAAAKGVAEQYLSLFPKGPHAPLARSIVETP